MAVSAPKTVGIADAAETLLNFSIDRNDLEILLGSLPENAGIDRVRIEYEMQILKILSVGWSLSFFLEDSAVKRALTESFWTAVQEFSRNLSLASSASLNRAFDYFAILKERLDTYLKALNGQLEASDPATVMGPAFSAVCGEKDNAVAILCGSKMFHLAVSGVRHYLESVTLVS
jgi:hypothetical protein